MNQHVWRFGRQVVIGAIGGVVVVAGIVLLLIPGPGIPLILLGLGILSLEFKRPRAWLAHLRARAAGLKQRLAERRARSRSSK